MCDITKQEAMNKKEWEGERNKMFSVSKVLSISGCQHIITIKTYRVKCRVTVNRGWENICRRVAAIQTMQACVVHPHTHTPALAGRGFYSFNVYYVSTVTR